MPDIEPNTIHLEFITWVISNSMQTIDESMMSGVEKKNWIIFISPAKAELCIVVLLLPRNQSHLLPAYVSSHIDQTE